MYAAHDDSLSSSLGCRPTLSRRSSFTRARTSCHKKAKTAPLCNYPWNVTKGAGEVEIGNDDDNHPETAYTTSPNVCKSIVNYVMV